MPTAASPSAMNAMPALYANSRIKYNNEKRPENTEETAMPDSLRRIALMLFARRNDETRHDEQQSLQHHVGQRNARTDI